MSRVPPPPPPPVQQRGPTPGQGGNFAGPPPPPPPPPPGFRPQGGAPGPQNNSTPIHMPIRQMPMQKGTRTSDVTPPRMMSESEALRLLTTYRVYTIRKVIPNNPREKPTWAIADISEERLTQSEIERDIKRLNQLRKTVSEKKFALKPNQTTQVNSLLDALVSSEVDPRNPEADPSNFSWSLVQLDSFVKDIPSRGRGAKKQRETLTLTVYVARAPLPDKNPIVLYQQKERRKQEMDRDLQNQREQERMHMERQRELQEHHQRMQHQQATQPRPPPPPPQHPQQRPQHPGPHPGAHGAHGPAQVINLGKNSDGNIKAKPAKGKPAPKKHHHHEPDSSSDESFSDSESDAESFESVTSDSSISVKRRHSVSKGPIRSHSRHRPDREVKTFFLRGQSPSPDRNLGNRRRYSELGDMQHRPYVPEPPRMTPSSEAITSAYLAGKEDAMTQRFATIEQTTKQTPVIIQHVVERPPARSQPLISYGRPETHFQELRRSEPHRYIDDREQRFDNYHSEEEFVTRRHDVEDYIRSPIEPRGEYRRAFDPSRVIQHQYSPVREEGFPRRPLVSDDREEAFGRRSSVASPVRMTFDSPNPFSPIQLPRRYATSSSSDSFGRDRRDPGW